MNRTDKKCEELQFLVGLHGIRRLVAMTVLHILNIIDTQLISFYIWTANVCYTYTCVLGVFLLALYQPEWETIFVETIACGRSICFLLCFSFDFFSLCHKATHEWNFKIIGVVLISNTLTSCEIFVLSLTLSSIHRWKISRIQLAWKAKCWWFFSIRFRILGIRNFFITHIDQSEYFNFQIFFYYSSMWLSLITHIQTLHPSL